MAKKESDISPEMEKRIINVLDRVWNTIAYDLIDGNGGRDVSRSVVIECCLDANRPHNMGNDLEAAQFLYTLPYKTMQKLGKKAFPHSRYGL